MRIDSVFSPLLTYSFESDRPEIPIERITVELDGLEDAIASRQGQLIETATDDLIRQATPSLASGNVSGIAALESSIGIALQQPIFEAWERAYTLGSAHGLAEMISAAPNLDILFGPLTIRNTPAEQAVLARTIELAGNFSGDVIARLKGDLIASVIPDSDTGKPISRRELRSRIRATLNVAESRAEMIARTESTAAYNTGRISTYNQSDAVEAVRFLAIQDSRTSAICFSRNGMIIPKEDADAIAGNTPPLHVNCVVGETRVKSHGNIRRVTNRLANVELCVIRVSTDHEIACTPNHPILTDRGWVPAKDINLSSKVACSLSRQWEIAGDGHDQHVPPTIKEVSETFIKRPSVVAVPVPTTAPHFHGDGAYSKVAIINSDSRLVGDLEPVRSQHPCQDDFVVAGRGELSFFGFSSFGFFLPSLRSSPGRFMRSLGQSGDLFWGGSVHPSLLLFRLIANVYALLLEETDYPACIEAGDGFLYASHPNPLLVHIKNFLRLYFKHSPATSSSFLELIKTGRIYPSFYGSTTNSKLFGKRSRGLTRKIPLNDLAFRFLRNNLLPSPNPSVNTSCLEPIELNTVDFHDAISALAGSIEFNEVVYVGRRHFSGHVYNLETEHGYYEANSIITANCRSVLSPIMPRFNARHRAMTEDPARSPQNMQLAPLPRGWRTSGPVEVEPVVEQAALEAETLDRAGRIQAVKGDLIGQESESGVLIDSDGNVILRLDADGGKMPVTADALSAMDGQTLVRNHDWRNEGWRSQVEDSPDQQMWGQGFTGRDLQIMHRGKLAEYRIVSGEYEYILRPGSSGLAGMSGAEYKENIGAKLAQIQQEERTRLAGKVRGLMDAESRSRFEFDYYHAVNERLAVETGMVYHRRPVDSPDYRIPVLPKGTILAEAGDSREYQIRIGDRLIGFQSYDLGNSFEVAFEVDGSFARSEDLDKREGLKISLAVKRIMDYEAHRHLEGVKLVTLAYDDDGLGDKRKSAYQKFGFHNEGLDEDGLATDGLVAVLKRNSKGLMELRDPNE